MGSFGKKSAVELDDLWENMSDFITSHVKISDFGTSETRFHNFKLSYFRIRNIQKSDFRLSNVWFHDFKCKISDFPMSEFQILEL